MRVRKTIKIDEKEITLKEFRVKDVIDILKDASPDAQAGNGDIVETIKKLLPICSDMTVEDLFAMAPSEIKQVYEAFKEANAVFFEVAQSLGLGSIVQELKNSIRKEFSGVLADSFSRATSTLSTTDSPGS